MNRSIVVGRAGESLTGTIVEKTFTIDSSFGMSLTFKTKDIRWIHFRNPPNIETDEIWTQQDDRARGEIRGRELRLRLDDGSVVKLPYGKIHTVIVNQAWSPSKRFTRR